MSKAGRRIIRGATEALTYARGEHDGFVTHVPNDVDVSAIRRKTGLSQAKFAARFGVAALRWVNHKPTRDRHLRGVNCQVLEAGSVALGDEIEVLGVVGSQPHHQPVVSMPAAMPVKVRAAPALAV